MRDYAELILDLRRHHCDAKEDDTQEVCEECAYDVIVADKSKFNGITDVCTCGLMHRAADAIEELQNLIAEVGKMVDELITYAQKNADESREAEQRHYGSDSTVNVYTWMHNVKCVHDKCVHERYVAKLDDIAAKLPAPPKGVE